MSPFSSNSACSSKNSISRWRDHSIMMADRASLQHHRTIASSLNRPEIDGAIVKYVAKFRFLMNCFHPRMFWFFPLVKGSGLRLIQTWRSFTQWLFVPRLLEISPVVLEKKYFFKISFMYYRYIQLSPLGKKTRTVIWINFILLFPGMICAKLGWNWTSGSGEEDENLKFTSTTT